MAIIGVSSDDRGVNAEGSVLMTIRGALWLAVVALLACFGYAAGVVLPYFVNDLDRLPLEEWSNGRYDPKDLWPNTVPGGIWLRAVGFFSLALTPLALVAVAGASIFGVVRSSNGARVAYAAITLACVVTLLWFASPLAGALATWMVD
jgi:uncharacterized membrane protein YuzA (DUF378 family)